MNNVTPIAHARKKRAEAAGLVTALAARRYRLDDETVIQLASKAHRLVLCGRSAGAVRARMVAEVRRLSAENPEVA